MPLILSILNTKGGTGKTTTAVHLAHALVQAGQSVELWDADPQGSVTEWALDAAEIGQPFRCPYLAVNVGSLRRQESTADVVVIDNPPGSPDIQTAAAARADLVIIPTAPSVHDLRQVWRTVEGLGDTPAIVLLTQADPRTISYRESIEALDAQGTPRFDAHIKRREAYRMQVGAPTKLREYTAVAHEVRQMTEGAH